MRSELVLKVNVRVASFVSDVFDTSYAYAGISLIFIMYLVLLSTSDGWFY